jgi:hypothetical protein
MGVVAARAGARVGDGIGTGRVGKGLGLTGTDMTGRAGKVGSDFGYTKGSEQPRTSKGTTSIEAWRRS